MVALPAITTRNDHYKDILLTKDKNYILKWNDGNTAFEVHELNLSTGALQLLGSSGKYMIPSSSFIEEIDYDSKNKRIVGLVGSTMFWVFDLATKDDNRIPFPIDLSTRADYEDLLLDYK